MTLLLQLTTSLGLMALSTTIVDVLAVRVLPYKAAYRTAKVDEIEVTETGEAFIVNPKPGASSVQEDPFGYRSQPSNYGSLSER